MSKQQLPLEGKPYSQDQIENFEAENLWPGGPMSEPDNPQTEIDPLYAFATVVLEMRKAQREYFANRTQANLKKAKGLEAAVDTRLGALGFR